MKRLLFTLKLLAVLLVVDACFKCEGDPLPYSDFKELQINYWGSWNNEIPIGEEFNFVVYPAEIIYMVSNNTGLNLISSAWAREECPQDGHRGFKYGIDSVRVISSANWDVDHFAGSSLNEFVYLEQWWDNALDDTVMLSEVSEIPILQYTGMAFQIRTSPTVDLKHVFHLTYYKSNGETVEGFTDTITWVP
ncbi:hypothetical protein [Owenweeksia hongkongensis]|uniref:hypothetical protein n=1 Tax=Owenweeksia hongkongensis TaxID=253245 RepID=UPI003A930F65